MNNDDHNIIIIAIIMIIIIIIRMTTKINDINNDDDDNIFLDLILHLTLYIKNSLPKRQFWGGLSIKKTSFRNFLRRAIPSEMQFSFKNLHKNLIYKIC